jgi:ubiquinone/menaquinone biosynthesis C-methylase UbiE
MYHSNEHSGNTPEFWAEEWDQIDLPTALKQCESDPLRTLFDKYVKTDHLILEGGCGKGHWVTWFANRGNRVVGLDFSARTLSELADNRANLELTAGNVNALPFDDNSFDIYYSGGVVEHFEAGCGEALDEARRVIRPDGTLLLSVPYYSPLRKALTPFRKREWRRLSKPEVDRTPFFDGLTYFQYLYDMDEFKAILAHHGLNTIETFGYSVTWGLYDIKFFSRRAQRRSSSNVVSGGAGTGVGGGSKSTEKSLLKHLVLDEATSTPLESLTTRLMRRLCANMMMFVCRKR